MPGTHVSVFKYINLYDPDSQIKTELEPLTYYCDLKLFSVTKFGDNKTILTGGSANSKHSAKTFMMDMV